VATTVIEIEDVVDLTVDDETETAAAFIARLNVAAVTGKLPEDVGRWAVQVCTEHLPAIARRLARDRHLRLAANLLSGSAWAKARRLEREIQIARGRRAHPVRVRMRSATVAYHVRQALAIDPATPASTRHILRVLGY